ncbi:Na+/H+ antiporter subunit E [Thioalkalivibrio sulfidiphilus]|uniref:Cation antiporter n=1 Tax=Thioalkalivibrio sulfidiphilus (strain HL-EbGR7) TaxID=396588 RepID=B8GMS9_THISH|nr:Na+/H+ antiporter subunit E [Thioalkalivibrio sulfidiphilus]ACL73744.1 cation antiporter [Thioalkalivibrio sulfidiphilus HL-EbGr7]
MDTLSTGRLSRRAARARRFAITLVLAALLWWVLAGHASLLSPLAWLAILGAAVSTLFLPLGRPFRLSLSALPGFAVYFLSASVAGGVDVARRALSPAMPLKPGFVSYTTELPHGAALTFFMAVISLLPGTLSVRLEGRLLTVHVLDTRLPIETSLSDLEGHITRVFIMAPRPGGAA